MPYRRTKIDFFTHNKILKEVLCVQETNKEQVNLVNSCHNQAARQRTSLNEIRSV